MKTSKKVLLISMTLLIVFNLVMGGCTTARKPMQPTPSTPIPGNPLTPDTTSPDQPYPADVANRAAAEAEKISGVNQATALVSDKTIYVGLDLKANLGKQESAATEKNVMNKVKSMESGYNVSVTSDMDIVTGIKNIAQGVAQGKPLSSFSNEIANIDTRLNPRF